MATKKKTTTKQAAKRPARKTIEAFDAALDPPASKQVIAVEPIVINSLVRPEPILEAEDFNPFDPTQFDRSTELVEPRGEDRSEELQGYGYPDTPEDPPVQPAPTPQPEPVVINGAVLGDTDELEGGAGSVVALSLIEQAKAVENLIEALNYLYPKAKRKVLAKDTPILKARVARGRQLIALLRS